ncbi:MAG: DUF1552 domain-containing protein [Zavarzinella sp.]
MANILSNRWFLNRRTALRGIGVSIALPMLDCMQPLATSAETAATLPKRSVFLYIPNGVNTLTWQIQQAGKDYQFSGPMKALEKHRSVVTPISGLHHPMVIGKHHNCDKVWLTGADVPSDGGAFRNSVSADQLIAEVQGEATRHSSLELAIEGHSLAWSRDGIQLPVERNTVQIFNLLFGATKESKESIRKKLSRKGSILDLVADDAGQMQRQLGADDRRKLDEYLTAVRQVEKRTKRADAWLNIPKPQLSASEQSRLSRKLDMTVVAEYQRLFYDLMVMALRTDSTRVISCMIGSESHSSGIPDIGISQTRHGLSHHNGDPEQLRRLTQTDAFLVEQFAYFLDQLQTAREGDRTLLDTTQILWGSGMAYGHSHGNANLPTILAGGKALGYRHGQHIDFNLPKIGKYNVADAGAHYKICSKPVDSDARLSNLLLTMVNQAGVTAKQFNDSTRTLTELMS